MKLRILIAIVIFSAASVASQSASPARGNKPDRDRPAPATNVELVKKITVRGRPASPGGGKPTKGQIATGELGLALTGSRSAIVVGISDYPDTGSDLQYCDDDADAMYAALTEAYGFRPGDVAVLKNSAATRGAILDAIDDAISQAGPNGEIVFFYSGHGASGAASDGDGERIDEAMVVWDTAGSDFSYIWDGELRGEFADCSARIVFIFDSCLAGGMQQDLQGPNRVIPMAAGEHGYSYETDALQHGEFTYYFVVEGILAGKANVHNYFDDGIQQSGQVTIEEAFDYSVANCSLDRPCIGDYFSNDLLP